MVTRGNGMSISLLTYWTKSILKTKYLNCVERSEKANQVQIILGWGAGTDKTLDR